MTTATPERQLFGPLRLLSIAVSFILGSLFLALIFKDSFWAIPPIVGLAVSILLDLFFGNRKWLKHNEGVDIVATNNVLALTIGSIVSLSIWLKAVAFILAKMHIWLHSPWVWLIGFSILIAVALIHARYVYVARGRMVFLTRTMGDWCFKSKVRWKLLWEVLVLYGLFGPALWLGRHVFKIKRLKNVFVV